MLLLTFRYTGPRLSELVTLRTDEVDLEARQISLVGKGRKPRVIPIPHLLADVLREYRETLRPSLPESAYLFANPNGNRSLRGRYGPRALHNLVLEAGTSAGVAGRHFPHRWRHSYATSLVRRGEDIHVVQTRDGPFQRRDDYEVPALVGRGSPRSYRPGLPGKLSSPLLGGSHLWIHAKPRLKGLEVGPVGLGEVHFLVLLDRSKELRRAFQLL